MQGTAERAVKRTTMEEHQDLHIKNKDLDESEAHILQRLKDSVMKLAQD
jgi:hypothetical protein